MSSNKFKLSAINASMSEGEANVETIDEQITGRGSVGSLGFIIIVNLPLPLAFVTGHDKFSTS